MDRRTHMLYIDINLPCASSSLRPGGPRGRIAGPRCRHAVLCARAGSRVAMRARSSATMATARPVQRSDWLAHTDYSLFMERFSHTHTYIYVCHTLSSTSCQSRNLRLVQRLDLQRVRVLCCNTYIPNFCDRRHGEGKQRPLQ